MVNLQHPALLIMDVQVDICAQNGFAAKLGRDLSQMQQVLPLLKKFYRIALSLEVPVIFMQYIARKDLSPRNIRINKDREEQARMCLLNSRGSDIYYFNPKDHDYILQHRYYDAFADTELKKILQDLKVHTLLLAGMRTELSIDSTAKRAISEGYEVVILSDLVATYPGKQALERGILQIFDRYFGYVLCTEEIREKLER